MINLTNIAKEVKEEILEKVKSGVKVADVSSQYGVSDKTIYSWLRGKAVGVSIVEFRRIKKENEELKQIVGAMSLELAKLKKRNLTSSGG